MRHLFTATAALIALALALPALAQSTAFSYQGDLTLNGEPAQGSHDFEFTLWNALSGGAQIGSLLDINNVPVEDGVFTVQLDFGAAALDGNPRWLQIRVGRSGALSAFTLSPRQPITGSPYAVQTRGIRVDENLNVEMGAPGQPVSLNVHGAVLARGAGGGAFQTRNPNNDNASFSLGWLNDVARLRIGGTGPGAGGGLDIQRTGDASLMRIQHDGNVGIGTTAPEARLHVAGDAKVTGQLETGPHGIKPAHAYVHFDQFGTILSSSPNVTDVTRDPFFAGNYRVTIEGGVLDTDIVILTPMQSRRIATPFLQPPLGAIDIDVIDSHTLDAPRDSAVSMVIFRP